MEYQGLSEQEAEEILKQTGANEIPQIRVSFFKKILKKFISPISLMLFAAAFLSLYLQKVFDCYFILILLAINIFISLWQENKADNAIRKLNEHLVQKIKVLRDNSWKWLDSRSIAAKDVIQLATGDIIPADGIILNAQNVTVNESALTGESLPKEKKEKDAVYSGSFISTGIAVIRITATGKNTSYGKTVFSVERIRKKSLLEKDVIAISKFLTFFSLAAVLILTVVFLFEKASRLEILTLDLSLIIAGIPVSLPTVMTLIIEFGVVRLAKEYVIVRRLSALEDLANVNFLLTDKTGTLTKNKITVQDIYAYDGFTHQDVLLYAFLVSKQNDHNVIDEAIAEKAAAARISYANYKITSLIPADSERKRSTAVAEKIGKKIIISMGAPQIIELLCKMDKALREKYEREVETLAQNGFRSIAVAINSKDGEEKQMQLVGILGLSDTLREDAKGVINFLKENNIGIAMLTGDNKLIAQEIAKKLNLSGGKVIDKKELDQTDWSKIDQNFFYQTGAFAEILPEDKLKLIQKAKEFFIVAANGDGVNDLPAIKAANVGLAVKNAVTALKSAADIVLLSDGISVIRDAIIESRKIFARVYTYSLYRISESLRLIVTIVVLGILYRVYPLTALQIIIVALLNDIPIISLAFDRVKISNRPAKINLRRRFILSSFYGFVGVANSLILFFIISNYLHLDWKIIQTIYFLKLTVSGHMLIYVVHTKERWYKFLPSREVIWATTLTQLIATALAFTGFLMPGKITISFIILVWVWSFFWMQISELIKNIAK